MLANCDFKQRMLESCTSKCRLVYMAMGPSLFVLEGDGRGRGTHCRSSSWSATAMKCHRSGMKRFAGDERIITNIFIEYSTLLTTDKSYRVTNIKSTRKDDAAKDSKDIKLSKFSKSLNLQISKFKMKWNYYYLAPLQTSFPLPPPSLPPYWISFAGHSLRGFRDVHPLDKDLHRITRQTHYTLTPRMPLLNALESKAESPTDREGSQTKDIIKWSREFRLGFGWQEKIKEKRQIRTE